MGHALFLLLAMLVPLLNATSLSEPEGVSKEIRLCNHTNSAEDQMICSSLAACIVSDADTLKSSSSGDGAAWKQLLSYNVLSGTPEGCETGARCGARAREQRKDCEQVHEWGA